MRRRQVQSRGSGDLRRPAPSRWRHATWSIESSGGTHGTHTVFERDPINRGINVPPLIVPIFDREGNLKETTACDTYGNVIAIPRGPHILGAFEAHAAAEDKKSSAKADTAKTGATVSSAEKMPTTPGKGCHTLMPRQERPH